MEKCAYSCLVTCVNEAGKIEQKEVIFETMPEISRYLLAFKPKNGYEIRHVMIHQEHFIL